MEFRNIFIANPAKLSIYKNQLVVEQEEKVSIPIEDIGCVLLETKQAQISSAALSALASEGISLFVCDEKHMPCGSLQSLNCHSRQLKVLKKQMCISKPTEKQLWKDIVVRKILNQAQCLEFSKCGGADNLRAMAKDVSSGDTENVEAKAAAYYFPALFGRGFYRDADYVENSAMNYGYAIIRGVIARNLVVYGLEPCLGVHHHSELNQFNLADDLIEPFRPIIDLLVYSFKLTSDDKMTPKLKQALFNATNLLVLQSGKKYRVNSAIGKCVMSFAGSVEKDENRLELPTLIPLEEHRYA